MAASLLAAGGKRVTPDIGTSLPISTRRGSVPDDYVSSARAGLFRQADFSTQSPAAWAQEASKRFRSSGRGDTFGSTNRFANGPSTFQVMSYTGTTVDGPMLEYQPVWGQRMDYSFMENDPFRRNTNTASMTTSYSVDGSSCPLMRVMTQAGLNLLLSHETASNNLVNGRRRTPMETLAHLGITFLGFVQASVDYSPGYRLITIFAAGYGLAALPSIMRIYNGAAQVWLGVTRVSAAEAIKRKMGTDFVIGSEQRTVPAPNMTAGSNMVADPVQVLLDITDSMPYAPAGKGTYWQLGCVEKVNQAGSLNAVECARKDGLGPLSGRYQIVLKPSMNRAS